MAYLLSIIFDKWGFSLTHLFSVISLNIAINHTLSKTRILGLHLCHRQCGPTFNQFDIVGFKANAFNVIAQSNGHYGVTLGSSKVTNFGTI